MQLKFLSTEYLQQQNLHLSTINSQSNNASYQNSHHYFLQPAQNTNKNNNKKTKKQLFLGLLQRREKHKAPPTWHNWPSQCHTLIQWWVHSQAKPKVSSQQHHQQPLLCSTHLSHHHLNCFQLLIYHSSRCYSVLHSFSFSVLLVMGFCLLAYFLLLEFIFSRTPLQLPVDFLQSKLLFSEVNSVADTFLGLITILLEENKQVSMRIYQFLFSSCL